MTNSKTISLKFNNGSKYSTVEIPKHFKDFSIANFKLKSFSHKIIANL